MGQFKFIPFRLARIPDVSATISFWPLAASTFTMAANSSSNSAHIVSRVGIFDWSRLARCLHLYNITPQWNHVRIAFRHSRHFACVCIRTRKYEGARTQKLNYLVSCNGCTSWDRNGPSLTCFCGTPVHHIWYLVIMHASKHWYSEYVGQSIMNTYRMRSNVPRTERSR